MELLIGIAKTVAYLLGGVFSLFILYFLILQGLKALGKMIGSQSLYDKMYDISDNSKNKLLIFFDKAKFVLAGLSVILVVIFLFANLYGINKPIAFAQIKDERFEKVVDNLKDIREIQMVYKSKHGKYCENIDSLVKFAETDSIIEIKKIGDIEDSLAVARGEVKWDTVKVSVLDKLKFDNKLSKTFNVDSLKYIPFSGGEVFEMGAGEVMTGSKVKVQVFEAKAENKKILQGLDRQLIINLNDDMETRTGFPGLKVGSLVEANNNAGNWE